jgi:hypothetical protein
MRFFEITLPVLLALYLVWPHPRPLAIRLAPALALVFALIHFGVEGYRWQMIPLYALTALLTVSSLSKITGVTDWKPLASNLTFILLALSTAVPILLPVPKIPNPSGPYQIGTSIYEMTDSSRPGVVFWQRGTASLHGSDLVSCRGEEDGRSRSVDV